jgi:hypothetical protein
VDDPRFPDEALTAEEERAFFAFAVVLRALARVAVAAARVAAGARRTLALRGCRVAFPGVRFFGMVGRSAQ